MAVDDSAEAEAGGRAALEPAGSGRRQFLLSVFRATAARIEMIGDGFKGKLFSCVAAGLALGVLIPKMTAREGWNSQIPRQTPPSLLLISLDTVRADHLGCYGYSRIETPNIDRLAADSIRFT